MAASTNDTAYILLKASLGLAEPGAEISRLLLTKLDQAAGQLARAGIRLDSGSAADAALQAAYAEWLYSRRADTDLKPRSLVEEIRSRQIAQATGAKEASP